MDFRGRSTRWRQWSKIQIVPFNSICATLEYEFSRASGINMGIDGAADDSIKIAAIADVNTLLADVQARLINYPPFAKVSGIGN